MDLIDLLRKQGGQYLRDIMPGGLLSPEIPPEMPTQTLKGLLGFTPVGDAISGYDALQSALEGDWLGMVANGVGVLPGVPAMGGVIKGRVDPDVLKTLYTDKAVAAAKSRYNPETTYVTMTPDDFLALTHRLDVSDPVVRKNVDTVKSYDKFTDVPYLEVGKEGRKLQVGQHEGRHRAQALKEKGVEEMPVAMKMRYRMQQKYPNMTEDEFKAMLQNSKKLYSERGDNTFVGILD